MGMVLTLNSSAWPSEFTSPRDGIDHEVENKPYLQCRRDIGQEGSDIEIFMLDPEDADDFSPQVDKVRDFFNGTTSTSGDSSEGKDSEGQPFKAWMDDRSRQHGPRAYVGPLTAAKLYEQLSKRVSCIYGDAV